VARNGAVEPGAVMDTPAPECALDQRALHMGFLGLSVIPELQLTVRGLVDVGRFMLWQWRSTEAFVPVPSSKRRLPRLVFSICYVD
jgi:hypothetical protein